MESQIRRRGTRSTPKKCSDLPQTPIKPSNNTKSDEIFTPAKSRLKKASVEEIFTPEKQIELPKRTRNREVALSVKEVRKVAQALQRPDREVPAKIGDDDNGDDLALVEKKLVPSPIKKTSKRTAVKLPDKYEQLVEFFNSMVSSIRLLKLKGSMTTLSNISNSIQSLTDRRFTSQHLGQLKYILSEAIFVKKVLVHDMTTCCMKPELQILLQLDAFEDTLKHKRDIGYSNLMEVFRERMATFHKEHPEGDDVPADELPHPFNQMKQKKPEVTDVPNVSTSAFNSIPSDIMLSQQKFAMHSHAAPSFQRRFSRKLSNSFTEKTPLLCLNKGSGIQDDPVLTIPSPTKLTSKPLPGNMSDDAAVSSQQADNFAQHDGTKELTRAKNCCPCESNTLQGTPAKIVSTPVRLMAATPDIQMAKGCHPTPAFGLPIDQSTKRAARMLSFPTPRKKSRVGSQENESERAPTEDDELRMLPESLLQSIKEKERRTIEEKRSGFAEAKRRQKMIAQLPSIFNSIHFIFQSGNRSVMTKEELLYKIISSNCKIIDRREAEDQLKLLQEIASDWLSVKEASSGDVLYCVNKMCNPEEIRQRLGEAK